MRIKLFGKLPKVADKAIMEDSNAILFVEDWVGLFVAHGVLSGGITRVEDSDAALALNCLGFLLLLFDLKFVDELVHFEEAVVLLVHDHLVLKHVLVIGDSDHGHGELFAGQRGELARVEGSGGFTAERKTALLVRRLL